MPIKTALKLSLFFLFSLLFLFTLVRFSTPIYSGEVEQIEGSIADKEKELENQKNKLKQIESRIADISNSNYSLAEKISLINNEITTLQAEIDSKNSEIEIKLKEIEEKQLLLQTKKEIMDNISGKLYMQTRYNGGDFFFSVSNFDEMLQNIFIKRSALNILRDDIEKINGEFTNLADAKAGLEKEKTDLDEQKKGLDDSYGLLAAEKAKLQAELNAQNASKRSVSSKINGLSAELSDLQYQLIIARQGGTNVNPDSVPASSSDPNSTLAGFRANAPSGSFGVFSIGAYTHRNGMSQWGARARANAGQSYLDILGVYYAGKPLRTDGYVINKTSGATEAITTNIATTTYGTLNFEDDYLLRLGEVPEYWPMEVLKAQAIAARTYAINYTNNGRGTICTTESCQVVLASQKTGAWKTAVQATRGVTLTDGSGKPFSTQYAAVHGGWINGVGWDTTDRSGEGDWMARAYDSISGVSWFYKTWYRSGYSDSASSCGRNSWLTQSEMSDILNSYQVWLAHNRNDSRIYPIFDACHSSGNPYSYSETYSLAAKKVSSVSLVVTSNSSGNTNTLTFYTDAGTISMSGNDFKTIYNLRAPGYLRIPQSGFVHINIETK